MPAFPTFIKIWQRPITTSLPQEASSTLQNAKFAVAMKNAFLAPPQNPWVMKACSDSTATSTSADLIVNETDIVPNNAGAHTWWVLRNPQTGQEYCVDFNQANNLTITHAMSVAAGFTGGSTTARPTATDEVTGGFNPTIFCGANVGRFKLFLMHSTDGRVTYAFAVFQGIIMAAWMFGEMTSHHTSWSPSYIGAIEGSNSLGSTGLDTIVRLNDTPGSRILARQGGAQMLLSTTSKVSHGTRLEVTQATRESPTEKWQLWPIGLACVNSPRFGRQGKLVDMFRVPGFVKSGWVFRSDDGAKALMAIGSGWAVPWHPKVAPKVV